METATRIILRHRETGLYISSAPESYHTKHLRSARRFIDREQLSIWLTVSHYRPDNPGDYELVTLKITYETEEERIG